MTKSAHMGCTAKPCQRETTEGQEEEEEEKRGGRRGAEKGEEKILVVKGFSLLFTDTQCNHEVALTNAAMIYTRKGEARAWSWRGSLVRSVDCSARSRGVAHNSYL